MGEAVGRAGGGVYGDIGVDVGGLGELCELVGGGENWEGVGRDGGLKRGRMQGSVDMG